MPSLLSGAVAFVLVITIAGCSDDTKGPLVDSRLKDLPVHVDGGRDAPSPDLRALDSKVADQKVADKRLSDLKILKDATKGEGWNITCTATVGSGIASGTVQGQAISTTTSGGVRFFALGFPVAYGIAFFNQSGTCASLSQVVTAPIIVIGLCTYAPGTYTVGTNCLGDGAGISIVNGITLPGASKNLKATSGTITIDSFDPACGGKVKGSFSAKFSGDTLTGTFDTVSCGDVTVNP